MKPIYLTALPHNSFLSSHVNGKVTQCPSYFGRPSGYTGARILSMWEGKTAMDYRGKQYSPFCPFRTNKFNFSVICDQYHAV